MNTLNQLIKFLKERVFSTRKPIFLYIALLLLVAFNSCNKDDTVIEKEGPFDQILNDTIANDTTTVIGTITDEEFAAENFGGNLMANFIGTIVDLDGKPLKEVQITIGSQSILTDSNGVFVLNEINVNQKFAFVKAEKTDYILGSRTIVPSANGSNFINISLLQKNIVGTVESGESSETSLPNGAKVNFPGSFIDASGGPYSGKVEVSMHYLEPNQNSTFTQMPGMLFGKGENNDARAMETYGMLGVNLYSPSGEVLNISKDAPAQIRFPISTTTPNSPATIPLWYFDESVGYWKEQGKATQVGDQYLAEVSHFTWWNCDMPLETIKACLQLKGDNIPANYYFKISRSENNQIIYVGNTNGQGLTCGLFPKNEVLKLSVYGKCDKSIPVATQNIGPYSSDNPNIEINFGEWSSDMGNTVISANITNCSNVIVTNGYALLYGANVTSALDFEVLSISDGLLQQSIPYCRGIDYSIVVYDMDSNEVSNEIALDIENGNTDLGSVKTCEGISDDVFEGSITLRSQEEVDAFGLLRYREVTGNLNILIPVTFGYEPTDVSSLLSLDRLTAIGGDLKIIGSKLSSLDGFENLTSLGGSLEIMYNDNLVSLEDIGEITIFNNSVNIEYNDSLANLHGFEKITHIEGDLQIRNNGMLSSSTGFENVASIGGNLLIGNNGILNSLIGFENLASIGGNLTIGVNSNLSSLLGLENLTSVTGGVAIFDNNKITSLTGLQNLNSIEGFLNIRSNHSLISMAALENLRSIGGFLYINNNADLTSLMGLENLNSVGEEIKIGSFDLSPVFVRESRIIDFCSLNNLLKDGTYGEFNIYNNSYNPTIQNIIDGNCDE